MGYASYHARDWAEGKTSAEISAEILHCERPRNYAWNEVGNATLQFQRAQTLRALLDERGEPYTGPKFPPPLRERVRHADTGMIADLLGKDDRGYFRVLRSDGLEAIWHPDRCATV